MNFIEAIEKHNTRLDAYVKTKSFGGADTNELRELITIFMQYVANPKGDMIPSLGCGNCISKMFQRLVTHREIERKQNVDIINAMLQKAEDTITISSGEVEVIQVDLEDQIKQEELIRLKSECKEKGIKFHHKAGIKKLKELLNA